MTTTIRVTQKTKERLDQLKKHPREPYDELLVRLLKLVEEE